jgi:hypothetical protein
MQDFIPPKKLKMREMKFKKNINSEEKGKDLE